MGYIFDTNIFIRSKNEMPMDVWPTFWVKIRDLIQSGAIYSSVYVKQEIAKGNDELTTWMQANAPKSFYIDLDTDIARKYARTQEWANSVPRFTDAARKDFAEVADAYLIATAAAKDMTLVTYETPDPNIKKRIKIPDVCNALNVRYCDLNTALRELNVTI